MAQVSYLLTSGMATRSAPGSPGWSFFFHFTVPSSKRCEPMFDFFFSKDAPFIFSSSFSKIVFILVSRKNWANTLFDNYERHEGRAKSTPLLSRAPVNDIFCCHYSLLTPFSSRESGMVRRPSRFLRHRRTLREIMPKLFNIKVAFIATVCQKKELR